MNPPSFLRSILLAAALAGAVGSSANEALVWDDQMMAAIRLDNSSPNLSSRNLAILHVAIYDAVNSIRPTHRPYRFKLPVEADTSPEAAAAGAGHAVMLALYPNIAPKTEQQFQAFLRENAPTAALTNGLALGRQAARLVLEDRKDDGIAAEVHYVPSSQPGQWRRTPPYFRPPLAPHWGKIRLFALPEKETFLPPPPPALDSPEYAEALNEVKAIGARKSAVRTEEQKQIAIFWSDFSYTAMPPGHWHEIAASICRDKNLPLAETARLFALLSIAQADAAIICWETKFRHNLWRPVTAIQRADEDGNAATTSDPKWDHLLPAPPFPAYTSGHSMFSKASAQVLTRFFGTDAVRFAAKSDSLPGVERHFASLSACADEVGLSRIYGGIHFAFDNIQGKASGQRIGDYVAQHALLPIQP
jgi:hypothetical protein